MLSVQVNKKLIIKKKEKERKKEGRDRGSKEGEKKKERKPIQNRAEINSKEPNNTKTCD